MNLITSLAERQRYFIFFVQILRFPFVFVSRMEIKMQYTQSTGPVTVTETDIKLIKCRKNKYRINFMQNVCDF